MLHLHFYISRYPHPFPSSFPLLPYHRRRFSTNDTMSRSNVESTRYRSEQPNPFSQRQLAAAYPRPSTHGQMSQSWAHQPPSYGYPSPTNQPININNAAVYVGNLWNVTEQDLRSSFQEFGAIASIQVCPRYRCGFVAFYHWQSAETAIRQKQGSLIGNCHVRLRWRRSTSRSGPYRSDLPPPQPSQYFPPNPSFNSAAAPPTYHLPGRSGHPNFGGNLH